MADVNKTWHNRPPGKPGDTPPQATFTFVVGNREIRAYYVIEKNRAELIKYGERVKACMDWKARDALMKMGSKLYPLLGLRILLPKFIVEGREQVLDLKLGIVERAATNDIYIQGGILLSFDD